MKTLRCSRASARGRLLSIAVRPACGADGPLAASSLGMRTSSATVDLRPIGRLRAGSPTTAVGRAATRGLGGFVSLRWDDAIATARVARLKAPRQRVAPALLIVCVRASDCVTVTGLSPPGNNNTVYAVVCRNSWGHPQESIHTRSHPFRDTRQALQRTLIARPRGAHASHKIQLPHMSRPTFEDTRPI